jgi:DNA polymerase elongation subunit (family B)
MVCSANAGFDIFDEDEDYDKRPNAAIDPSDFIVDIREYDVPYHVRVAIDKGTSFPERAMMVASNDCRYPYWKMVHSRIKTRCCEFDLHRGATHSC